MNNRFNLNESEKNRIKGLHGINIINEQEEANLETKIAMVDCAEGYNIPETVIDLAGSISDNMMSAVPEGKNPYSVWMAAFISQVTEHGAKEVAKMLGEIEVGSGCMYDILKSQDMLSVVKK